MKNFIALLIISILFIKIEVLSDELWGWGDNYYGEFGDFCIITPQKIGGNFKKIFCGNSFILVIKKDGTLWGWGNNQYGQLGIGRRTYRSLSENRVTFNEYSPLYTGTSNWQTISCGENHVLGLKQDSTLWAWGDDQYGQLGLNHVVLGYEPTKMNTNDKWIYIACGYNHSMAIKEDGTLWAWGSNLFGQLGDSTFISKYSPVQIELETNWLKFEITTDYNIIIKSDSTLWCWGRNDDCQLGTGYYDAKSYPIQIGNDKWKEICATPKCVFGIKHNGTLWGWGYNEYGQLGDEKIEKKTIPTQITKDTNWILVESNGRNTFGIKKDGTLWAWGNNEYGQLGDNSKVNCFIPKRIGSDNDWAAIFPYNTNTFGIKKDSTLWVWGRTLFFEQSQSVNTLTPTYLTSLKDWTALSFDIYSILGLKKEGNSILELQKKQDNLIIYPNPAIEKIFLSNIPDGVVSYEIFDIYGNRVLTVEAIHELPLHIDVSGFSSGVYFLKLNNQPPMKFLKI